MKILILTNSKITAGAGIVAKDFANSFMASGAEVKILVNQYSGNLDNVINIQEESKTKAISKLRQLVNNKFLKKSALKILALVNVLIKTDNSMIFKALHLSKYVVQDINQQRQIYSTNTLINRLDGFKPDAIIVLFMQNFINYSNLVELRNHFDKIPICISLLDMAPLTGGCHYAWDCVGYKINCKACPAVPKIYQKQIEVNLKFKKEQSHIGDFNYVYCSQQQQHEVTDSAISKNAKKFKILLPTNQDVFNNNTKLRQAARSKYGFVEKDVVVFFGAMDLESPRKGGQILIETISKLIANPQLKQTKFLIIGAKSQQFRTIIPKDRCVTLDVVSPEKLPEFYNAADIFISPSVADSGPMMVNQSVMCGTRVCAFKIGVALDLVKDVKECGSCAEQVGVNDLTSTIENEILFQFNNNRENLREACSQKAMLKTSYKAVAKEWLETIQNLKH